jgi:hypothetical protein
MLFVAPVFKRSIGKYAGCDNMLLHQTYEQHHPKLKTGKLKGSGWGTEQPHILSRTRQPHANQPCAQASHPCCVDTAQIHINAQHSARQRLVQVNLLMPEGRAEAHNI